MDDFGLNHGKEHQGEQSSDQHEGIESVFVGAFFEDKAQGKERRGKTS